MHIEALYEYCRAKPGVTEAFPFGEDVLVFKVMSKVFALTNLQDVPPRVNLKCDPARAEELRARYAGVVPGYHMNKRHWNTVSLKDDVPDDEIRALVDHSYELVARGLPRAERDALVRP